MKLEYLGNINVDMGNIVRLSDFDKLQTDKFRQIIKQTIIEDKQSLDLSKIDFIESINCNLTLRISENDTGIFRATKKTFFCDLTIDGYENMIRLLEPFCVKDSKGYQWLYDIDAPIDFLFSPGKTS